MCQRKGEQTSGLKTSVRLGAVDSWSPGIQDTEEGLGGDRRPQESAGHGFDQHLLVLPDGGARTGSSLVLEDRALAQDASQSQALPIVFPCLSGVFARNTVPWG